MAFVHLDVLFNTTELPELGFDADAFRVRAIHHALCDRDVFLERLVARVNHDGTVKLRSDAIITGFLVSMVKMHGKNYVGKHFLRRANHRFEHPFVGVFSRAFRELNNKRRLALLAAAEQPEELLHVVNVIGADGELSVGDFVKLSGGNDHGGISD